MGPRKFASDLSQSEKPQRPPKRPRRLSGQTHRLARPAPLTMNETISPDERGRHSAPKAEGDSDPALSRLGAGERLHMERMIRYASRKQARKAGQWALKKYSEAFRKLGA